MNSTLVDTEISKQGRVDLQSGQCPMQHYLLQADDELIFPMQKRTVIHYVTNLYGTTELFLYCGDQEICFDEPELYDFGENLVKHPHFLAESAMAWGDGYEWQKVRGLLEQLLEVGILIKANGYLAQFEEKPLGACPSLLPAAQLSEPPTWFACADITEKLTGRSIETGYLEIIIPVFRVAHIAMDSEGRQVGEANVFPRPLRLDIATDWRVCPHSGSRYRADLPMNVTALKSIRSYWPQIMTALLAVRQAFLKRFPGAQNAWTVGDLERLSSLTLAIPAYLLMRKEQRIDNGQLHPALSSMFRVTDGVRMTTHQMLFIPSFEPTLRPEAPMSSEEIYAYADRNYVFFSDYGVCAGPKAMIEDFLHTLIDGQSKFDTQIVSLDKPVRQAIAELDNAFNYGLYGLQVHAVVFSVWPAMSRTYEQLWQLVQNWPDSDSETLQQLTTLLRDKIAILKTTGLGSEALRKSREWVYANMYENSAAGFYSEPEKQSLSLRIAPLMTAQNQAAEQQLLSILMHRFQSTAAAEQLATKEFTACLMQFLRTEQAIVKAACEIQTHINALLGRDQPEKAFIAADIDIYYQIQEEPNRLTYLVKELQDVFKLSIVVSKDSICITDLTSH
ncbi:MAG: hypothetical protein ABL925_02070 [Methylococcales bacterium]